MKKSLLLTLARVLVCFALVFAGCTATDESVDDQNNVEDVNTNEDANNENNADNEATEPQYQYIDKADVKAIIDESQAGYVLLDLRKAADYEAGHIVTAVSADVDSAVSNSDNDTATANLQAALEAATGDALGGDNQSDSDLLLRPEICSDRYWSAPGYGRSCYPDLHSRRWPQWLG